MPYYAPSGDEVTQLIKKNDLFDIEGIRLFESNWDAHDDSDGILFPIVPAVLKTSPRS